MRQYFQKEHAGGPGGARSDHVKKWVAEQQKTEPCFISWVTGLKSILTVGTRSHLMLRM